MDLFGTDGVRGEVNEDITPELALKLGKSTKIITEKGDSVLICRDTRKSGRTLEYGLASGISSTGRTAYLLDEMPTPAIPILMEEFDAKVGVVVSASHNLAKDNGIKFFNSRGLKLAPNVEEKIEKFIVARERSALANWQDIGDIKTVENSDELYLEALKNKFSEGLPDLSGFKLVMDCGHGATYRVGPSTFDELGAEVVKMGINPTGFNINQNCGSTSLEKLKEEVVTRKADLGVAFDGDGDRALFVDENGSEIDGDRVLYMAAKWLLKEGRLDPPTVVSTVMSNLGLEKSLSDLGIDLVRTRVGDKYVAQEMLEREALVGGEQSGHVIFREINTTGDGLVTALMVLRILRETDKSISELAGGMTHYPQVLYNVPTDNKEDFQSNREIQKEVARWEEEIGERGRILVRPSGTQDVIRVMVEGDTQERAEEVANRLGQSIDNELNSN
ncbi:MAG: phosphoglucosamine mutase [Candidatus Bipolaricaulota bacterium]|nr:phosphoglucosamine mutase [Candidatus Bipolaricaulota bacterium]